MQIYCWKCWWVVLSKFLYKITYNPLSIVKLHHVTKECINKCNLVFTWNFTKINANIDLKKGIAHNHIIFRGIKFSCEYVYINTLNCAIICFYFFLSAFLPHHLSATSFTFNWNAWFCSNLQNVCGTWSLWVKSI